MPMCCNGSREMIPSFGVKNGRRILETKMTTGFVHHPQAFDPLVPAHPWLTSV